MLCGLRLSGVVLSVHGRLAVGHECGANFGDLSFANARDLSETCVNSGHVGEYAAVVRPVAHHEHVADLEKWNDVCRMPDDVFVQNSLSTKQNEIEMKMNQQSTYKAVVKASSRL